MARVRDARATRAGCIMNLRSHACVNGLRGRGTRTTCGRLVRNRKKPSRAALQVDGTSRAL
eukprot:76006-Prymnesium_polylepis.1